MIGRKKALTLFALTAAIVVAVPSIGMAGHYTGKTPASLPMMSAVETVSPVAPALKLKRLVSSKSTATKKVTIKSKHKKHKKHKKSSAKK